MYRQSGSKRWAFKVVFEILVGIKEIALLHAIKRYFNTGKVYEGKTSATYRVTSVKELGVIIEHFTKYPLLSPKVATYTLWVKAVVLLQTAEHLKSELIFAQLVNLSASLGRGVSAAVTQAFQDITPITLPEYKVSVTADTLNPWWISGYLTLSCSFVLALHARGWKDNTYNKYRHRFTFSLDPTCLAIANLISKHMGLVCYVRKDGRIDVQASSIEQCEDLILFLDQYPLQSYKHHYYNIWREAVILMSDKYKKVDYHKQFLIFMDKLYKVQRLR